MESLSLANLKFHYSGPVITSLSSFNGPQQFCFAMQDPSVSSKTTFQTVADSGCTQHLLYDSSLLINACLSDFQIAQADGQQLKAS
jgi:hypothetical protein